MVKILKESEDRYQEGEDEVDHDFPSVESVLEHLGTTGIPPNPEWLKKVREYC